MTFPSTILGYPRIGRGRELKRALESYWAGKIDEAALVAAAADVRRTDFARMAELGLGKDDSSIPENSSYYDQVLDITAMLGAAPERFRGRSGLDLYFALARGDKNLPPQEMTKYWDTNYHYIVPEIGPDTPISLASTDLVDRFVEAKEWGYLTRPVIVGPVTYLALAKEEDNAPAGYSPLERLDDVVAVYKELLAAFKAAGAQWVQLDEPALVSDNLTLDRDELAAKIAEVAGELAGVEDRPKILLAAPYGDSSEAFKALATSGVEAVAIDLGRGELPCAGCLKAAADAGITVVAGVIDGRNIWRADLAAAVEKLKVIQDAGVKVAVGTTTSLQHVPHDTALEKWEDATIDANLHEWLSFADQKIVEVVTLAKGLAEGWDAVASEIDAATAVLAARAETAGVKVPAVRERVAGLTEADRNRGSYEDRKAAQQERLQLPELPTTTIGSFPQTLEIRKARAAYTRGDIDRAGYDAFLEKEIADVIKLQEDLDLDVLVHGESERNDMVQYFAELLEGFEATKHGWVQSYGSRCTRPSILWGDVARSQDLTVRWWKYSQSLTDRPVKGMLTGPVTIIAWSFVRNDIPLSEVADQIALALRDEISALEAEGAAVIQVDEPALRELLPLDEEKHADYLEWSVGAFRAATAGAANETQIHTHLCYSEFGQIIDGIAGLDADVTSIEAARSRMEVLPELRDHGFDHGVGPGVWDIHSPRVPSVDEVTDLLQLAVDAVPGELVWANPDCGLKTRGYEETIASLKNLVAGAKAVRAKLDK
ncbi:MAG: 5-methyltetrahydropteroyltriglutamate--homocysteine S-methyltransferase [Actinomycetaceae bacterium]|nr:5-methyltetrahydropteroyltriglutamate--homocysteine S-methyltransferase [Actinomycetaceae bacterium]